MIEIGWAVFCEGMFQTCRANDAITERFHVALSLGVRLTFLQLQRDAAR